MKRIHSPDSNAGEKSNFKHIEAGRSSRWPWFFAAGGLLVILIALVLPRPGNEVPSQAYSTDSAVLQTTSNSLSGGRAQFLVLTSFSARGVVFCRLWRKTEGAGTES